MTHPLTKHLTAWNIGLLSVLLLGAFFLLTGWDAGLPLYESVDEVVNLNEVYALRGIGGLELTKPGYPPGILYVNYAAQLAAEAMSGQSAWDNPCLVIRNVRFTDVIASLFTALLVALTARKLGGDAAGLLAALAWLAAPEVLTQSQFGFPQVYEALMYMLALYLAMRALERGNPRAAILSTLAGLVAVIFKYAVFPVLGLGAGATLWGMRTDLRRWLRVLAAQMSLIAATALLLVLLGSVGALAGAGHWETENFLQNGFHQIFDLSLIQHIHEATAAQLGLSLPVFLALLVAGTAALWGQAKTWQRLGWLGAVGLAFSHTIFLGAYIAKTDVARNLLSVSGLVAVISVVAIIALGKALGRLLRREPVGYGFIAVISLLWLGPQLVGGWNWVQYRRLPVTYAAMVEWADRTMPEETLLVSDSRPFTRDWSCYQGHWRETIEGDITDQSIEGWLNQDVYYVQMEQQRAEALRSTPAGRAYLDKMVLLKQFPEAGQENQSRGWRRGNPPDITVYRLWPDDPQMTSSTVFGGEIRLTGYDLTGSLSPDSTLTVRFYWQPEQPPSADYNVYVHLAPANDAATILAQADGFLARSAFRPTSTWNDPDEPFISRDFVLDVPGDLDPGDYQLRVGLYDWRTGARLGTDDGGDYQSIPLVINADS